jgi:hypothetical protein
LFHDGGDVVITKEGGVLLGGKTKDSNRLPQGEDPRGEDS